MATYKNILNHVDKWEGGWVYIPEEGQYTNRGIQFTTFKKLAPSILGIKNPTLEQLKNITQKQWEKFVQYFWNKATFNNAIKDQKAANVMFQALWGSGGYGVKEMQRALKVSPDGVVGLQTVKAINSNRRAGDILFNALENYYRRLGTSSRYNRFVKGWLNRLNDLPSGVQYAGFGLPLFLVALGLYFRGKKRKK